MTQDPMYQAMPVEQIVGRAPGWLVRSGTSLVAVVILCLLAIGWLIRYPDGIEAGVIIETTQATVIQRNLSAGHVRRLLVKDGQTVKAGDTLAVIGTELDDAQVERLAEALSGDNNPAQLRQSILLLPDNAHWGTLQQPLESLQKALTQWWLGEQDQSLAQQARLDSDLVERYSRLIRRLDDKRDTQQLHLLLLEKRIERQRQLLKRQLSTQQSLDELRQTYLNEQTKRQDIDVEQELYRVKVSEINSRLVSQKAERRRLLADLSAGVQRSREQMRNQLAQWRRAHLVRAQIDGRVSLLRPFKQDQFVKQGEKLFGVVPPQQRKEAFMQVENGNIGKVRPGQQVRVTLDNFPTAEYGYLLAQVSSISPVPGESGYLVKLQLPDPLLSTYGKALDALTLQKGRGTIITQPRRLLQRFVDKLLLRVNG